MIPTTDMFGNRYHGGDSFVANALQTMEQMAHMPSAPRRFTTNSNGVVANDDWDSWFQGAYLMRVSWLQAMLDPRRDMDRECGYPYVIIPKQYRYMYDREGVATRVVDIYPDECWAVDPSIYEGEEPEDTPFEQSWADLCNSEATDPLHYMHRIDRLSGIGRYGVLLLGTDDGNDLSVPLEGIDEFGQPTGKPPGYKLLYMRPFDEMLAHIINYERNPDNPRFGQPVYYHILFADVRVGEPGMTAASISVTSRVVHWSRIIHVADNRESSEVFGVPRMQPVFNRLCDIRKVLGGSAEMFWKGGFPGYSFELLPELTTAGVTLDKKKLDEQFERYSNGLQRYLAIVGLSAKSLAPQVANPDPTLKTQLEAVAISLGVPLRVFTGSEQAQLASGQDVRTWNRRLVRRMGKYLTPKLVRPLIDRLVAFGILKPPQKRRPDKTYLYKVWWPDINMPNEQEQSQIADRQSAAIMKYITGGGPQLIPPYQFLTLILRLPADQAKTIALAINGKLKGCPKWPVIIPPAVTAAEVKGELAAEVKGSGGGE